MNLLLILISEQDTLSNLDRITLRNRTKRKIGFYHWEFKAEHLILTEFVRDTIRHKNEWISTDDFVLSDKEFCLRLAEQDKN